MSTDFSFDDRIVHLYNQQRAHPPHVSQAIGDAIAQRAGTRPVLEMGIGTGRIAKPIAQAGARVVGFDLSPQMLGEAANALSVTQADMHHMPYRADSFGIVIAVHVLHLADAWQTVLAEIARVLQRDGVFIQGNDWVDPQSVFGRLRNELRMHAVRLDPALMPPAAGISKADVLQQLGATHSEEVIVAEWEQTMSANDRLAMIEQRLDNESWILSDAIFDKMLVHLRDFAGKIWSDLDEKQTVKRRFIMKITYGDW